MPDSAAQWQSTIASRRGALEPVAFRGAWLADRRALHGRIASPLVADGSFQMVAYPGADLGVGKGSRDQGWRSEQSRGVRIPVIFTSGEARMTGAN